MFINRTELKVQMLRNNIKISDLAKSLHISRQSVSKKLNEKVGFSEKELLILRECLGDECFFKCLN